MKIPKKTKKKLNKKLLFPKDLNYRKIKAIPSWHKIRVSIVNRDKYKCRICRKYKMRTDQTQQGLELGNYRVFRPLF